MSTATETVTVEGIDSAKMLERVRALLNKAECTDNSHEAEAYTAKALGLVERYGIDLAMAQEARGTRGVPTSKHLTVPNPNPLGRVILLTVLARTHNCVAVRTATGNKTTVSLVGYESDIEVVEMLWASLMLQATSAMVRYRGRDAGETRSYRATFLHSFARKVGDRLTEARRETLSERTSPGTEMVLASRADAVQAAYGTAFPSTTTTSVRSGRSRTGYDDGQAAGGRANLGQTGLRADSRSLTA